MCKVNVFDPWDAWVPVGGADNEDPEAWDDGGHVHVHTCPCVGKHGCGDLEAVLGEHGRRDGGVGH